MLALSAATFEGISNAIHHSWIDTKFLTEKVAKNDDTEVPSHLWDHYLRLSFLSLTLEDCFFSLIFED